MNRQSPSSNPMLATDEMYSPTQPRPVGSILGKLMALLRHGVAAVRDPKAFAKPGTVATRNLFHRLFVLSNLPSYLKRRYLAARLHRDPDLPRLLNDNGHLFLQPEMLDRALVDKVIQEARNAVRETDLGTLEANSPYPMLNIPLHHRIHPGNPLLELALHPRLLAIMADYFGMLPVLLDIVFMYSPNRAFVPNSSQMYHLDGVDVRSLQVLVLVECVDDQNGPFTFIGARDSAKVARVTRYRKSGPHKRLEDATVHALVNPDTATYKVTGAPGTICMVDTDRCFHYGSRNGQRPRYLLSFQYATPYAFVLPRDWTRHLPFASLGKSGAFAPVAQYVLGTR